uniref:Uncharacterized protein n=1 Tax=Anguilla anguilla TaxID=7936 RepID=A0A0E9WTU2_ANGAN
MLGIQTKARAHATGHCHSYRDPPVTRSPGSLKRALNPIIISFMNTPSLRFMLKYKLRVL